MSFLDKFRAKAKDAVDQHGDKISQGIDKAAKMADDGVGVLYRGTEMVGAYAEGDGAGAYLVERGADGRAVETPLDVTRL